MQESFPVKFPLFIIANEGDVESDRVYGEKLKGRHGVEVLRHNNQPCALVFSSANFACQYISFYRLEARVAAGIESAHEFAGLLRPLIDAGVTNILLDVSGTQGPARIVSARDLLDALRASIDRDVQSGVIPITNPEGRRF